MHCGEPVVDLGSLVYTVWSIGSECADIIRHRNCPDEQATYSIVPKGFSLTEQIIVSTFRTHRHRVIV